MICKWWVFRVQVKNKSCVRWSSYMRLISWIHPRLLLQPISMLEIHVLMWVLFELEKWRWWAPLDPHPGIHQTKLGRNMSTHMVQVGQSMWLGMSDIRVGSCFTKRSSTWYPFPDCFMDMSSIALMFNDKWSKFLY
jgi:hypothetical protein